MAILSVRLSRPGAEPSPGEIDSGSTPYDSLESLVSNEAILVPLGQEIPLERGHQIGVPPYKSLFYQYIGSSIAWKRLQIDTDLLRIVASTADELSSGTNIDDLERPYTPKIRVLVKF